MTMVGQLLCTDALNSDINTLRENILSMIGTKLLIQWHRSEEIDDRRSVNELCLPLKVELNSSRSLPDEKVFESHSSNDAHLLLEVLTRHNTQECTSFSAAQDLPKTRFDSPS